MHTNCPVAQKRGFFARLNPWHKGDGPEVSPEQPDKPHHFLSSWVSTGNCDYLRRALRQKVDLNNMLQTMDTTALHVGAVQGIEALSLLLGEKLRDNRKDSKGQYAIHVAAASGNEDVVTYLLKNFGADINAVDQQGLTPAMVAVQHDHVAVASVLMLRGADILRCRDKSGQSALHYTQSDGMLLHFMLNTAVPIDVTTDKGQTLLHLAAGKGNAELVERCIDNHASPNVQDKSGRTPLHLASDQAHSHIVQTLVRAGADAAIVDKEGYTPVELALLKQHTSTADFLYKAGVVFTKRQMLYYSILKRDLLFQRALDHEDSHADAEADLPKISHAWKQASQHPNLQFPRPGQPEAPIGGVSTQNLLNNIELIRDPLPRPPGGKASATLTSVFSSTLRHSMSIPRPAAAAGGSVKTRRSTSTIDPSAYVGPQKPLRPLERGGGGGTSSSSPSRGGSTSSGADSAGSAKEGGPRKSLERLLPHYLNGLPKSLMKKGVGFSRKPAPKPSGAAPVPTIAEGHERASLEDAAAVTEMTEEVLEFDRKARHKADIRSSLFFQQGKVSTDSHRSNSFPSDGTILFANRSNGGQLRMRGARPSVHRRRNPWGAAQEPSPSDDERMPPRHLNSMPHRNACSDWDSNMQGLMRQGVLSEVNLENMHERKMAGMEDFEDMMARRAALVDSDAAIAHQ